MTKTGLECGPQFQWQAWWKEEARDIGERIQATGISISQDQLLGEGPYAEAEMQVEYDDTTLALCCKAALSAWDRVKDTGKRSELLTDI